ncbi:MAG: ATP-dependent Clp protease ATP-binding subunit ClpA [Polyangiaceae bacterium]|jgi:ATP-dependent Clp protease ATP-binding subunit ClpC|nr:ATP-dependent Clp protease ATP-binding subunit ClpA [Polyangiaceae bacterium]
MSASASEPELRELRKLAEDLARRLKERASTAHLLAALVMQPSSTSELLRERRVTPDDVLRTARGLAGDELAEPIVSALTRAKEIGARMGTNVPSAPHLLLALLGEPRAVARRTLETLGVDASRLRAQAMQVGLGLVGRRRPQAQQALSVSVPVAETTEATPAPRKTGAVKVPLFPPPKRVATAETVPLMQSREPAASPSQPPPEPKLGLTITRLTIPSANAAPAAPGAPPPEQRFQLDPQRFPLLCELGRNLTLAAARGELDPVVGRDDVIEQTLDVLAKREGNNPCLVGVSGVGKTSVVRGLAQRIAEGRDVQALDDRLVIQIPIGELIAGTAVRGALAGRIAQIRKEVLLARGRVVLFFDEIHQLFLGEAAEEISSELKLSLSRGELPCIGATTFEEFQKAIGHDAALARRFGLVEVEEPSREDAFLILDALRPRLEQHHRVSYDKEALAAGVAWSIRYLPGRALPDKAVSILDLAGARTRRRGKSEVGAEAVAEVVAELSDMPVERLLESDGDRMLRLEEILADRVVGHGSQIGRIARILRRNAAGLGSRRPIGTFLLLGPTGVGKTETAKAIAEVLFHCESAMTRLDLSEFSEAHSVARLIGAPPGYVGHEAGGQLTEAVRRRPYQVILLDELEKAHPDVLTTFLGVFDEGRLTDGRGRLVDFTNTVILMTSNLGAEVLGQASKRRVGFGGGEPASVDDVSSKIVAAARAALAPELYNRIDEVLVFAPLSRDDVREIARRLLDGVRQSLLAQRGVELEYSPELLEYLMDAGGFEPTLGARPMKRTIARLLEAPLAERILRGELPRGGVLLVNTERGELLIDVLERRAPAAE